MDNSPILLYVEDDEYSCQIMQMLMEDMLGWKNLAIFQDSANFLDRVEQLNPQPTLILLDIHVIPYSGFDMLRMLRAHPQLNTLPIVALTASVMNEEVQQLKTAGFDGVVAKPIDLQTFPGIIQRIMLGESFWQI